jgi:predicted HicB family RNase H-like nuclease
MRTPAGRTIDDRTKITVRLPPALLAQLQALAKADQRPLNNWIVVQLETAVAAKGKP